METGVVLAGLSPHPPIVVPEVGRGEEKGALSTVQAMETLGQAFASADYDTLVVITPHGLVFRDAVSIRGEATLEGDLREFGAGEVEVSLTADAVLAREISAEARREAGIATVLLDRRRLDEYRSEKRLDHGVLVPLYFMVKHGYSRPVVVINMGMLPMIDLYRYGLAISRAARRLGRRIAVLASGDLSHRLSQGSPGGYSSKGKQFDERLMGHLKDLDPKAVVDFPLDLAEEAGECGLRPIVMMLGALDEIRAESEVLSYEGPFGVGYGIVLLRPAGMGASRLEDMEQSRKRRLAEVIENESFAARLARAAVDHYVKTGKTMTLPGGIPVELARPAGVFVSIHKEGMLRGCIGTTGPTRSTAAEEIVQNAISAAIDDPRFRAVSSQELPFLDYSVDILSEPEPVESEAGLDPEVYGVIVEKRPRRGLLLPDLPGVDSVEDQLRIARQKAGIGPSETGVLLQRFTVTRYH